MITHEFAFSDVLEAFAVAGRPAARDEGHAEAGMTPRVSAASLIDFATSSLQRLGMEPAKADAVADVLVEGDLLGPHDARAAAAAALLEEIEKKQMTVSGGRTSSRTIRPR